MAYAKRYDGGSDYYNEFAHLSVFEREQAKRRRSELDRILDDAQRYNRARADGRIRSDGTVVPPIKPYR